MQVRATAAGRRVVEQVMTRRRADPQDIVEATSGRWRPEVIAALTAFADAAGEADDGERWLGWSEHDNDDRAEGDCHDRHRPASRGGSEALRRHQTP